VASEEERRTSLGVAVFALSEEDRRSAPVDDDPGVLLAPTLVGVPAPLRGQELLCTAPTFVTAVAAVAADSTVEEGALREDAL
jgi:hypothetical protein